MESQKKFINGLYVMDAFIALGKPVYLTQIIVHIAKNRHVDPRLIQDEVSDTIRTGIKYGFIYQATDGKLCNFRKCIKNEILSKTKAQLALCTTPKACTPTPVTTVSHERSASDRRANKRCHECNQFIAEANNSVNNITSGNVVDDISDTNQSNVSSGVSLTSEERDFLAYLDKYSGSSMIAKPKKPRTAQNAVKFSENKKPRTPKKK